MEKNGQNVILQKKRRAKMVRYSKSYIIIKKDLEEGFVKKHTYKSVVEYWCYKAKKSRIFKLDGSPATLRNIDDATLSCIIVCNDHFKEEKDNTFIVKGYRFDENDMEDYLRKTSRGING